MTNQALGDSRGPGDQCCEGYASLATPRRSLLRGALLAGTTTGIGDAALRTPSVFPGFVREQVGVVHGP